MTYVFEIVQKWETLWEKLEKAGVRPEVEYRLKIMLGMARSKRHLRTLHNKYLGTCLRLLNPDFQLVESFWVELNQSHVPAVLKETFLLFERAGDGSMAKYYYKKIWDTSKKQITDLWTFTEASMFELVLSDLTRSGQGDHHFQVELFDKEFELACFVNPENTVRVCISMWSAALTEKLTHDIITKLPAYWMAKTMTSTVSMTRVDIVYDLEIPGISEYLTPVTNQRHMPLIATRVFLKKVMECLEAKGVPITKYEAIT